MKFMMIALCVLASSLSQASSGIIKNTAYSASSTEDVYSEDCSIDSECMGTTTVISQVTYQEVLSQRSTFTENGHEKTKVVLQATANKSKAQSQLQNIQFITLTLSPSEKFILYGLEKYNVHATIQFAGPENEEQRFSNFDLLCYVNPQNTWDCGAPTDSSGGHFRVVIQ